MADMRNRTPFYGAVPTSKLNADHVFMADGSTLQEQADRKFELIETITIEEAVNRLDYTFADNYNEFVFIIENSANTDSLRLVGDMNSKRLFDSTTARTAFHITFASFVHSNARINISRGAPYGLNNYNTITGTGYMIEYDEPVSTITLTGVSSATMDIGTTITVYAR